MNKVMLMYPPGKLYQRGEDRAQCNIEDSSAGAIHACNDLGYCAAILKQAGYSVCLRDCEMEHTPLSDVVKEILLFQPDLLFLSTTASTIFDDLKVIRYIRRFYTCRVVLKGALFYDADLASLQSLNLTQVDCLVGGEVEFIIEPLADALLRGKGNMADIAGIIYREAEQWKKTVFGCWNQDLDSLPFPARDLMRNELYVRPDTGEAMATISVARGCPSRCTYCLTPVISGKKVRFRSVENVMSEIEECFYKYHIHNFFFKADTFTINRQWAMELCDKIIHSDLSGKIAFTANARADTVSPELLAKMKQAGCFMIGMGFESGSDETLRRIKKGTTVRQNERAAELIKQAGIPLFAFFMIGFPWETREDMQKTCDFILRINPDFIEVSIAMPYSGTPFYETCKQYGVLTQNSFGHDYYIDPNTRGTNYVPMEEVVAIRKKTLLKFYLRPQYIAKKMWHAARQPKVIGNYIDYGFKLLKKTLKK